MDFENTWEQLKDSASAFADSAVRKTRKLSDLAQLHFALDMQKSDLKEIYRKLGKAYHDSIREGKSAEKQTADLIARADEACEKIREYEEEIRKRKEEG